MLTKSIHSFFKVATLVVLSCFILYGCVTSSKSREEKKYKVNIIVYPNTAGSRQSSGIIYKSFQIEFGKRLAVPPDSIFNEKLYVFIKEWLGTPYQWGGNSLTGIDCSAFVQRLYQQVYDLNLPRTSIGQFYTKRVELYSNAKYLSEGDLVFFKTIRNSNAVTHVGFYLHNGYFVNASSVKGVSLGNLKDRYWNDRYVASGRLKGTGNNGSK